MTEYTKSLIRVGIVGTGYIAEFHARAIQSIEILDLTCVCDPDTRRAKSFATIWNIPNVYTSLQEMLQREKPDCIHLLVPPDLHYALAKVALEAGVHVLLEKPMCTSVVQADELLALAERASLYLGVSHNFTFINSYERLRTIVQSGQIGPIDQISIHHLFELPQIRLGPFDNWIVRSPANVILETGPHLLSALIDLAGTPNSYSTISDRNVILPNGCEVFRRWRVRTSVAKTSVGIEINFGPGFPQRLIYVRGQFGAVSVDLDANTCTLDELTPLDVDLDRYKRIRKQVKQLKSQSFSTLADYILGKLKFRLRGNPYQNSIIDCVKAFYSAVHLKLPLDRRISAELGRNVIEQCLKIIESSGINLTVAPPQHNHSNPLAQPTILVLGGSGFIGRELIRQLLEAGYSVRAMVRGSASIFTPLKSEKLQIVHGDIRNEEDVKSALIGIEYVYHLARANAKTWEDWLRNDVEPARLIGELCLAAKVKRLVYTGTIDSYYAGTKAGIINEQTPLDRNIQRRNYYARAKAEAEKELMALHQSKGLPLVIFRPGIVIGRGGNPFHWGVGRFSANVCEVWGDGNTKLPFVLVEDVASALKLGIETPGIEGRSYNLIDLPLISAREYLDELEQRCDIKLTRHYRPIWRFFAEDFAKWAVKVAVKHPDRMRLPSYFDWDSRTQKATFDSAKARTELKWAPSSDRNYICDRGITDAIAPWLDATR